MTWIINFVSGPGCGKSTMAAGTFAKLKRLNIETELVTEYAKDIVWDNSNHLLENQIRLIGEQYHRLWRLQNKVDVVVTDSPLFLLTYYGAKYGEYFSKLVLELHNQFDNVTYLLKRNSKYNPVGRNQTEEEVIRIDEQLIDLLNLYNISYTEIAASELDEDLVIVDVLKRLK